MKTEDIKQQLINEILKGNIKQTGYMCPSGSEYIEIRNALFEVDKDYIFDTARLYMRVPDSWYEEHYDPILKRNDQFNKMLEKLGNNPNTRQAIIYMGDSSEYSNGDEVICTMYMHIFLDHIKDNYYKMTYIVHMRSNDAIEFGNDIRWHRKIIENISIYLYNKYDMSISESQIFWNADSFHVYKDYFNLVLDN